ncbi:MAG: DUF3344 domain-containing protein [Candidatus Methanospirare jalkutatii]|nr:MAG: DUF3344 domain-containing protein [Candidatus Methanospirare jalkutatii]
MKKMNERKKVIGVAMAVIIVASIFAVLTPAFARREVPPGYKVIFYLEPDNSSAPAYCNTTVVQLRVNSTEDFQGVKVTIHYDPACANITDFVFDPEWESYTKAFYPGEFIVTAYNEPGGIPANLSAGDYLIGNLTIHCNSTTCCITDLIFDTTPWETDIWALGVPHILPFTTDNGTFACGKPSITVDKKVYDPATGTWVDSLDTAEKGKEYMFRIDVTASACADFTNLVVNDTLSGVIVANCTSVSPSPAYCSDTFIQWIFPTLNASETKTLYFNATVTDYGMGVDKASATAYSPDFNMYASAEDTASISAPVPYLALIYLKPQNSSAHYCENATVEVWVNSSVKFQSGQINLTYDPACADVVDWVRNEDVFPHGTWDSSKPGEEWITFARNDEIVGEFKIGTLKIHCNNTCNCTTTLNIVDYAEVLPGTRYTTVYDASSVEIKTKGEDGKFTCTQPDLIVTEIKLNPDAPKLGDRAVGPTNHTGAKRECNNISATIKNIGNGAAGPFYVRFNVSHMGGPEEMLCEVLVSGLAAGAETTVDCKCKWYPFANEDYTIIVTADSLNDVTECNEANNTLTRDVTPVVNGYKGDGWQDGRGIDTYYNTTQGHFNVRYSVGDSYYLSGYHNPNWTTYTVNWTKDDLSIPNAATIKKALLYVYYCWDKSPDGDPTDAGDGYYVNLTFNGISKMPVRHFTDRKGFGYYDFPFGMIVYDVTNELDAAGTNTAVLTYTWPSGAYKDLSIKGMVLLVVYEHINEPERIIFINEGFDILSADKRYGVSSEEATTYAKFNITEDVWKFGRAKLITIAPNASDGDDKNRLYFNDHCWKGVWDHYVGDTELGINETDVTLYIKQGENIAAFQSHIPAGGTKGDFMDASNAILILEKGKKKVVEIVPADVTVQPQDQFDIEVVVSGSDVYAVQYTIKYDPSVLKAESQVSGDFLSQDGNKTMVVVNKIDHATGTIEYAETRIDTDTGVTGRGTVAKIQFTAIGEPGATTSINITEVVLVDSDKQENKWYEVHNATVKIYKNKPPVILCAGSKHMINNAQKKYESLAVLCVNVTDYDKEKGYNISYIRWSFGDGQYGTTEGGLPCDPHSGVCCICKNHSYITWKWNSTGYEPLNASVTVTDDGCPEMSTTEYFDVIVYMAGDANGDGVVNILDAVWIGKHFREKCDGPAATCCGHVWSSEEQSGADLNNDCEINILDAVIVGTMWGHTAW